MQRLIDAESLGELKYCLDNCLPTEWERGWNDAIDTIMEDTPTVDAVPLEDYKSMEQTVNKLTNAIADAEKHGHWCVTQAYPHTVYCSECFQRFAQAHWAVWEDGSLPRDYCPNCGAKMDEGERRCQD